MFLKLIIYHLCLSCFSLNLTLFKINCFLIELDCSKTKSWNQTEKIKKEHSGKYTMKIERAFFSFRYLRFISPI
jgi:hypothetical protein